MPLNRREKSKNSPIRQKSSVELQSHQEDIESKSEIVKHENNSKLPKTENSSIWQTWSNVTSLHGFVDFGQEYGRAWKCFWIICILFGLVMVSRGIAQLVDDYYDSPTANQIHKYPKTTMNLPDLIVCPLQGLNGTVLKSMGMNDDLINGLWFTFRGAGLQHFATKSLLLLNKELSAKWYEDYKRFKLANNNIKPKELLKLAGLQCESFFVSCHTLINPHYSCCDNAQEYYDQTYGKCFRLTNIGHQMYPGEGSGITVLLNLTYYREGLLLPGAVRGVAIEPVHPGHPSNIQFKLVPVNSVNQLALTYIRGRAENIDYLEPICRHYDMTVNDTSDISKSTSGCFYRFYGDYVSSEFQCVPFNIANASERECDFFEFEYKMSRMTLENFTKFMRNVERDQGRCIPSCENHEYSVEWTFADFDPSYFHRAYEAFRKAADSTVDDRSRKDFSDNFKRFSDGDYIVLDVHFKDMAYIDSAEVFVFSFDNLISNVGGTLGLWLGASILSVIQLFAYCVRWSCQRRFR